MPITVSSGSISFAAPRGLPSRVSHRMWLLGRQSPGAPGPGDPQRDASRRAGPNAASRCSPPSPTPPRPHRRIWGIAASPNRSWVTNTTFVRTWGAFAYPAFVTDARPPNRSSAGRWRPRCAPSIYHCSRSNMRCGKRIQIYPSWRIIPTTVRPHCRRHASRHRGVIAFPKPLSVLSRCHRQRRSA